MRDLAVSSREDKGGSVRVSEYFSSSCATSGLFMNACDA